MRAPAEAVRRLVENVLGPGSTRFLPAGRGGWTTAEKWLVETEGRRSFVKVAREPRELEGLRRECAVLLSHASPHLPTVLGADVESDDLGVLVLEDLSRAAWPPPWPDDLDALVEQVRTLHRLGVPPGLPRIRNFARKGWIDVARDPGAVLALGLFAEDWLERALPSLLAAEQEVDFEGTELVHGDLGAPNLCWAPGRGIVVVDWSFAAAGNGAADLVVLGADMRYSSGGRRRLPLPGAGAWAAAQSGSWAVQASAPPPPWASDGEGLRAVQRELARAALEWACEELGLPPPRRAGTA